MKYISFAIPCYNSEAYMEKAINSILAGGEDVEIIVVNDGSKDGTQEIAEKYGKNAGQVILRFEVQEGLIVLPKSTNPERIAGNIEIFDFELNEEEMERIRALDTGKGSHDPEAPGVAEMLLANYKIHD